MAPTIRTAACCSSSDHANGLCAAPGLGWPENVCLHTGGSHRSQAANRERSIVRMLSKSMRLAIIWSEMAFVARDPRC